jgi:hypothetical protein
MIGTKSAPVCSEWGIPGKLVLSLQQVDAESSTQ